MSSYAARRVRPRNPSTASRIASPASACSMWPAPGSRHELGVRDAARRAACRSSVGTSRSASPCDDERRHGERGELVERVVAHRGAELAEAAGRRRGDLRAVDEVLLDPLGMAVARLVAVEEPRVLAGRRVAGSSPPLTSPAMTASDARTAFRPPGVVHRQDERAHALGVRQREALRDHAAERRADDVRRPVAGRVEHRRRVRRHLRDRVLARGRVRPAGAAVVERDRSRSAPTSHGIVRCQPYAVRSEAHDEQHRIPDPCTSQCRRAPSDAVVYAMATSARTRLPKNSPYGEFFGSDLPVPS